MSSDERAVEEARLLVRRAQEALGVLVAADGPIDVAGEPAFELPPSTIPDADLIASRADVRLIQSRVSAARRRAADSWKEYLPSVTALFTPQVLSPTGLFANSRSWRAAVLFAVPVFDGGQRRGQRASGRRSWTWLARTCGGRAAGELRDRIAREAVAAFEQALAYAQRAADQANEVVRITNIAFMEGEHEYRADRRARKRAMPKPLWRLPHMECGVLVSVAGSDGAVPAMAAKTAGGP